MANALTLAGAVLVAGALSLYVAGPFGMAVLGGIVLALGIVDPLSSTDGTAPTPRNCPDCGAPNPPDGDACRHCESALDG